MQAGHKEEYADGTSAVPWPQLDGVRPKTLPALDGRRIEDGEPRGGAKSNNTIHQAYATNETVRSITDCSPVTERIKCSRLKFFGHPARSAQEEDHHRVVSPHCDGATAI